MTEQESQAGRSGGRSILHNGMWASVQQAASMAANSVIAILLITVLPVEEYGVYSYALALTAFGMAVMNGGISSLAVRDFVTRPQDAGAIAAAVLVIRETLAFVALGMIAIVSLTAGESQIVAASLIAGASLFGRALDAPELWYRARMRTDRPALIRLAVTIFFFFARLIALFTSGNVWLFLILYVLEAVVAGIAVLVRYNLDRTRSRWIAPSWNEVKGLTRASWPLLLSGIANQVNLRADVIVIQIVAGATSVAVYSAAARISELAYFIPVVFMNASLPVLLRHRVAGDGGGAYRSMLQRSYDLAFWVGVIVAAAAFGAGAILISTFFGAEYDGAVGVLAIHVLACPFVFMAAVYSKWIIAEGVLWLSLARHTAGAIINVTLCFLLIPAIGVSGAAWATVVSYIIASYLTCFFDKRSREAGVQMSLAIVAPIRYLYRLIRPRWRGSRF